jgi:hypothetical protein
LGFVFWDLQALIFIFASFVEKGRREIPPAGRRKEGFAKKQTN